MEGGKERGKCLLCEHAVSLFLSLSPSLSLNVPSEQQKENQSAAVRFYSRDQPSREKGWAGGEE